MPKHYPVALASVCAVVALLAARGCYSPKPAPLAALPLQNPNPVQKLNTSQLPKALRSMQG